MASEGSTPNPSWSSRSHVSYWASAAVVASQNEHPHYLAVGLLAPRVDLDLSPRIAIRLVICPSTLVMPLIDREPVARAVATPLVGGAPILNATLILHE